MEKEQLWYHECELPHFECKECVIKLCAIIIWGTKSLLFLKTYIVPCDWYAVTGFSVEHIASICRAVPCTLFPVLTTCIVEVSL